MQLDVSFIDQKILITFIEGAESRPYRSNEREETYSRESDFSLKSQTEVQMKRYETMPLGINQIKLTQNQKPQLIESESRGQDSMVSIRVTCIYRAFSWL